MLTHFRVGDVVTSIHRVAFVAGGREVLLYTCLYGTIGVLVPFVSKEDVKSVVDGDLCEQFARLSATKQSTIAGELDRIVGGARAASRDG